MQSVLGHVWWALWDNWFWMAWNLTLAVVPFALALNLFRPGRRPTLGWWLMGVAFLVLLPNAPYVLTDIVHFVPNVQGTERLSVAIAFIAQYGLFFLVGVECYVASVVLLTRWLASRGWRGGIVPTEVGIQVLCAAGVYMGRVERLNSWDMFLHPDQFAAALPSLVSARGLGLTALTLVVVSLVYWTGKWLTLALVSYRPRLETAARD
jgi:uncharacterized membrane protein